jgi:hypothetical protein
VDTLGLDLARQSKICQTRGKMLMARHEAIQEKLAGAVLYEVTKESWQGSNKWSAAGKRQERSNDKRGIQAALPIGCN